MQSGSAGGNGTISTGVRNLLVVAAGMTWALVTMGGIVCTTGSGMGCAGWPQCQGGVVPPPRMDAVIEYTHRFFAVSTFPLVLATAILVWRRYRARRWLTRPLAAVLVLFVAVSIFGALVVLRGLPPWAAALDVGSALTALALVITVAAVASARPAADAEARPSFGAPFTRLALASVGLVFALLVTGVLVSAEGSITRCLGWPLYGGGAVTADIGGWAGPARRVLGAVAGLAAILVVVQAYRTRRDRPDVLRAARALGLVVAGEALVAGLLPALGFHVLLRVVYVVLTVAVWGLLVLVTVRSALPAPAPAAAMAGRPSQATLGAA